MEVDMLLDDLAYVLICRYSIVATMTVLVYDYFATLEAEVRLVWLQKPSVKDSLFFLNRYNPVILVFMTYYYVLVETDFRECKRGLSVITVFGLVGLLSAELVFVLRANAVWGHRKSLKAALLVMFLITSFGCSYFMIKHIISGHVLEVSFFSGCIYSFKERNWIFLLIFGAFDFFAFILLLAKRQTDDQLADTKLMRALYQESLRCFCLITLLTFVNLIMQVVAPPTLLDGLIIYCFPDPKESYLMFSAAGCSLESDKHTRTPIGGVP